MVLAVASAEANDPDLRRIVSGDIHAVERQIVPPSDRYQSGRYFVRAVRCGQGLFPPGGRKGKVSLGSR